MERLIHNNQRGEGMSTVKTRMYEKIEKHGQELIKFFGLKNQDPIKLSKALLRIERTAHNATTCLCNTNTLNLMELNRYTGYDVKQATEEEQDAFFEAVTKRLEKVIGKDNSGKCFINHDPRGYALKIKEEHSKEFYYKDWGGYGILAPEFDGN